MRLDLTRMQVDAIRINLQDALSDDERAYLDTLEGETDLYELVRRLLGQIEDDEGQQAALAEQIADRTARKQRCGKRIDANREAIMGLLECAGLDKLVLPEATLSVRTVPPRLAVNDPAAVPEDFVDMVPKPSMERIKAQFQPDSDGLPNWLRVEDARPSLTVRRK